MANKTIRDLLGGAARAEIINLLGGNVVRILTVMGDQVEIDAISQKVVVPLDTEITFKPWFMDRGNLLFSCPGVGQAKFCTEADILRVEGRKDQSILPE